jgi:hypothetical protein
MYINPLKPRFTVRIIRNPYMKNELLIIEAGGTYSYYWTLKGERKERDFGVKLLTCSFFLKHIIWIGKMLLQ